MHTVDQPRRGAAHASGGLLRQQPACTLSLRDQGELHSKVWAVLRAPGNWAPGISGSTVRSIGGGGTRGGFTPLLLVMRGPSGGPRASLAAAAAPVMAAAPQRAGQVRRPEDATGRKRRGGDLGRRGCGCGWQLGTGGVDNPPAHKCAHKQRSYKLGVTAGGGQCSAAARSERAGARSREPLEARVRRAQSCAGRHTPCHGKRKPPQLPARQLPRGPRAAGARRGARAPHAALGLPRRP